MDLSKVIIGVCIICAGLGHFSALDAQQADPVRVSGTFVNSCLIDFVEEIENESPLKFYFQADWVKDVVISFSGKNVPLATILEEPLSRAGLAFYIEDSCIYIYPGEQIVREVPQYQAAQPVPGRVDSSGTITASERKYLEGKTIASIEVLEIGDKQKASRASKCIISGKIIDEENSEPLIGATIYIKDLEMGAASDIDGRFSLILAPGRYKADFNYISMKAQEFVLQVYSSGPITIKMRKELIAINEVKISANRHDNVKGMQMGYAKVSAKEMKEVPVVFGEKDILKVAQLLPGVLNVGEGSSGFNIRGSSADQNMFYINKVPVYNTSHLFGFFSSFNPDIINDFTLYKSNIPAKYGGRLASIFDISTRQGSKKKFFSQGGVSPISAHFTLEAPVIKDKVSLTGSWRQSYSDWMLNRINDKDISKSSASFYDGSIGLNAEINDNNLIRAFGYLSRDRFSLSSLSDYDYSNKGTSISWKHIFSSMATADISAIYSGYSYENTNKTNMSTAYEQDYGLAHYEVRADFSLVTNFNHQIDFGGSGILYDLDRGRISPFGEVSNRIPVNFGKETGLETAVYLSDEFTVFKNLRVRGGLRYSFFRQYGPAEIKKYEPAHIRNKDNISETELIDKGEVVQSYSGPEYRIALAYLLGGNNSVKASYNRLYQYIFMLSNTIAVSPEFTWKICDYHIRPPVLDQISVGYYHNFNKGGIEASIELYHKWIDRQVEYKDGIDFTSPYPIETKVLQGRQDVNGIELLISKNLGKATGWISYSYSRSFMRVDGEEKENQINYGLKYPSNYDRPNSLNLVLNYRVNRRLSLSSNFVYTTGRPITYPVAVYYSEGQELLHFSKRNEYRIPDYIRLDLSINLEGNLNKRKIIHSFWSLNLYNALGRKNAYSVFYSAEHGKVHGQKLSIFALPIVTLSWNYKFGNYLNE